ATADPRQAECQLQPLPHWTGRIDAGDEVFDRHGLRSSSERLHAPTLSKRHEPSLTYIMRSAGRPAGASQRSAVCKNRSNALQAFLVCDACDIDPISRRAIT